MPNPIAVGLGSLIGEAGGKIAEKALGELRGVIDELAGGEEARELKLKALDSLATLEVAIAEAESLAYQAYAAVLVADAKGDSWLQKNWRPLLNVSFGYTTIVLLIGNYFGFPIFGVEPIQDTGPVLQTLLGMTGVVVGANVVGRSWEKSKAQDAAAQIATAPLVRDVKAERRTLKARTKAAERLRKAGWSEDQITEFLNSVADESA